MLNAGRMSSLFEVVREFYLPHVVTDTDSNIGNRVTSAIKNLIAGTFEKVNESRVKVSDSPHLLSTLGVSIATAHRLLELDPELLSHAA